MRIDGADVKGIVCQLRNGAVPGSLFDFSIFQFFTVLSVSNLKSDPSNPGITDF